MSFDNTPTNNAMNHPPEGSLNAGWGFDEIPAGDPTDGEEVFVLNGDGADEDLAALEHAVVQSRALEAHLSDLDDLLADMRKAGGMTQAFALEADKHLEGFLSEARPLAFFSHNPSGTLYNVATEEIHRGMWALIAAAAAAAALVVWKIVVWIKRKIFGGGEDESEAVSVGELNAALDKVEESGKKAQAAVREIDQIKVKGISLSETARQAANNTESATHAFLRDMNPVVYDIYDDGPYSKFAQDCIKQFGQIHAHITARQKRIDEVARRDATSTKMTDEAILAGAAKGELTRPLVLTIQGKQYTIREATDHLSQLRASLSRTGNIPSMNVAWEKIMRHDTKPCRQFFNNAAEVVKSLTELEKHLKRTEKLAGSQDTDGGGENLSRQFGNAVREMLSTFTQELTAVGFLHSHLKYYVETTLNLRGQVQQLMTENVKRTIELIKGEGEKVPRELLDELEVLQDSVKEAKSFSRFWRWGKKK